MTATRNSVPDLTPAELDALAAELDAIRAEVLAGLGADDAAYIRRVVEAQRRLEVAGRATLFASLFPPAWLAGTALLATAKILENMEIGHNVLHGQWDWLRDPAIHSTTWEWDHVTPADQWKHAHNHVHHTYTNIVGLDRDVGYGLLRMTPDQPWAPRYLAQLLVNAGLALNFQWGVALYDAEIERGFAGEKGWREIGTQLAAVLRKGVRQTGKDYVAFPVLAGPACVPVLLANLGANTARNVWAHTVIFCGHFPGDVTFFEPGCLAGESRGAWYLRQLLGSANIDGPPLLHLLTGNLSHQIEHHLFPDLPSNRYAEIAPRVRALCERFGLPYNSASLPRQAARAWGRVARFSLPNWLTGARPAQTASATRDAAPGSDHPAGNSRSAVRPVSVTPPSPAEPWQTALPNRTSPPNAASAKSTSRAKVTSGNEAAAANSTSRKAAGAQNVAAPNSAWPPNRAPVKDAGPEKVTASKRASAAKLAASKPAAAPNEAPRSATGPAKVAARKAV